MNEEFRTINYLGLEVTVSNKGTVIVDGTVKQHRLNSDGYVVVSLNTPEKGPRSVAVHRLVALAFVPNPNNLPEVNHLDYNRANPCADNLEWTTHADNIRYSICNKPDVHGENNPNYGNRKLSQIYAQNKALAKEKQSRPGLRNGRCVPVDLYYDDELIRSFDYMVPCCQYLIDIGVTQTKNPEQVRVQLNKDFRENRKYKGHYSIVKK